MTPLIRRNSPGHSSAHRRANGPFLRSSALATAAALLAPTAKADLLHCHMLLDLAGPFLGPVLSQSVEALDEGCRFQGVTSEGLPGQRPALTAATVVIEAKGFDAMVEEAAPPRRLSLSIEGLAPAGSDQPILPRWERVLLGSAAPIHAVLAYHWDEITSEVEIDEVSLDFGPDGSLRLTGRIENVDLRNSDTAAVSLGSMGFSRLRLDLGLSGLVEHRILPLVGPLLLGDFDSPEAGMDVRKGSALDALAKVPEAILAAPSAAALGQFISALPEAEGALTLEVEAVPGLGAARFFGFAMTGVPRAAEEFWTAFVGVSVRADWVPVN